MKKDVKIANNKDFISTFEELGFLYQECLGFCWMRKQDVSIDGKEVYFHAGKYGHRLYLHWGHSYFHKNEGFYLDDFQNELVQIVKSIDIIYDEIKENKKIGFFNRKIKLDNETIYISSHSSFSTERGFIIFSNYE